MQEIELFSERLKAAVKSAGGADFVSRETGIPRRTLETYLSGQTEPKLSKINALSRSCNVNVEWLMTGDGDKSGDNIDQSEWVDLPLFDNAVSTKAINSDKNTQKAAVSEDINHSLLQDVRYLTHIKFRRPSLEKYGLDSASLVAVRVSGDAMLPVIQSEDSVLVDTRASEMRADDVGVFRIGPQLIARRLQYLPDGSAVLSADNTTHAKVEFASAEQVEAAWVGKIVWVARWIISA